MSIEDSEAPNSQEPTESAPAADKQPCDCWRLFLDSKVIVALVTVLIGGLFGQCISASIQNSLKEREFQQAWLKARGDQALQSHKEYLDKEQEMVIHAYDLIGKCLTAARDLIDITDTDFALAGFKGKEREKVADQKTEVLDNYGAVIEKWDSEGNKTSLLIGYYHPGHPEVKTAWVDTQNSVNKYLDCARQWYKDHELKPQDTTGACKKEKDEVDNQLTAIGSKLETARQYSWEGWESPEKLRAILNQK
jgi:hypothetical protein